MASPARGEFWLVDFYPTKGREQSGLRPALIVSDDRFNLGPAGLVVVLPVTTRNRGYLFHIQIDPAESGLKQTSFIMVDQIRTVSKDRLVRTLGNTAADRIDEVEDALRMLLAI